MVPDGRALAEFKRTILVPAKQAWETSSSPGMSNRATRFNARAFIEACRWLRIAARAEMFPSAEAMENLKALAKLCAFAAEYAQSEKLLTDDEATELAKEDWLVSTPTAYSTDYPRIFSPKVPHRALFFLWAEECFSFIRSASASSFVMALNDEVEQTWLANLTQLAAEEFEENPTELTESLFEGYLRSVQHLNRMAELLSVSGTHSSNYQAIALMRVELVAIHGWRLNMQNPFYRDRFSRATEVVEERLVAEAAAKDIPLETAGLSRSIRSLIDRYLSETGFLSVSASG